MKVNQLQRPLGFLKSNRIAQASNPRPFQSQVGGVNHYTTPKLIKTFLHSSNNQQLASDGELHKDKLTTKRLFENNFHQNQHLHLKNDLQFVDLFLQHWLLHLHQHQLPHKLLRLNLCSKCVELGRRLKP